MPLSDDIDCFINTSVGVGTCSMAFDWQVEYVANTAFGPNDRRWVRTRLELASEPQDLSVYAPIKNVFVDSGCLR